VYILEADFVNEGLHWDSWMRKQRRKVSRHMLTDMALCCRRVLGCNDMASGAGGIAVSKETVQYSLPQITVKNMSFNLSTSNLHQILYLVSPIPLVLLNTKSRDREIVRTQKEVSKGRPNTPPNSCSVLTNPQVYCEVMCNRSFNQMLFQ
jgi:hypothetical protein